MLSAVKAGDPMGRPYIDMFAWRAPIDGVIVSSKADYNEMQRRRFALLSGK